MRLKTLSIELSESLREFQDEEQESWTNETSDGLGLALNPDVATVCRAVSHEATQLLPRFIRDDYEVVVDPLPLGHEHARVKRVGLFLRRRRDGTGFAVDHAAEGFQLWVQLAISEATDSVLLAEATMYSLVAATIDTARTGETDREDLERAAAQLESLDEAEDPEAFAAARFDLEYAEEARDDALQRTAVAGAGYLTAIEDLRGGVLQKPQQHTSRFETLLREGAAAVTWVSPSKPFEAASICSMSRSDISIRRSSDRRHAGWLR